jgi:LysM repeat protein
VSEAAIMRTNGLKSFRQVKVGKVIVIPVGKASRGLLAGAQLEDRRVRGGAQARSPVQKSVAVATAAAVRAKDDERASVKRAFYVVRPGDTLWGIAAKFSTTVDRIKRLNGMAGRRGRGLQAGQRLSVPEQS